MHRLKNKSKSKPDGDPPNPSSSSPPVNVQEEKVSSESGLSKAQIKRRRKKAMSQRKEDEEQVNVAEDQDDSLPSDRNQVSKEEEIQKGKSKEEIKRKNEAVNKANDEREVEPKKKSETRMEPKKKELTAKKEIGKIKVPYEDRLPEHLVREFKESFIPQGTKEYAEVLARQPNIPDVDDVVIEAVKWAVVKKKIDRGEKATYKSRFDAVYDLGIEELADSIAHSTLIHNEDNDDGMKSLERFLLAPTAFDDLPFFKWNPAMPKRSKIAGASKATASKSMSGTVKQTGSRGASKTASTTASKRSKSHSSQSLPDFELDMARSLSEMMSSGAAPSKKTATSEGAVSNDSIRKVIMKSHDSPLVLSDEAYSNFRKGMNAPIKVTTSVAGSSELTASESLIDALAKDFSNMSCPGKADVKQSKEEEKPVKKKEKIVETSKYNPLVSMLADPFSVSRNLKIPTSGALMFFIQEGSKVRHPMDKKPKSVPEDATRRLTELVRSAGKKSVEHLYDYHFRLVEFQNLPGFVRRMASRESTGIKFEKMEITSKEYKGVVACSKSHGKKLLYKPGEPVARLVIMCLPLELSMPAESLTGLAKDIFRVPCNDSSVETTYEVGKKSVILLY